MADILKINYKGDKGNSRKITQGATVIVQKKGDYNLNQNGRLEVVRIWI